MLAHRLRELAFLNPGVEITLTDERVENKKETFFYKLGVEEFGGEGFGEGFNSGLLLGCERL